MCPLHFKSFHITTPEAQEASETPGYSPELTSQTGAISHALHRLKTPQTADLGFAPTSLAPWWDGRSHPRGWPRNTCGQRWISGWSNV